MQILTEVQREQLLEMPESGMGYQLLEAHSASAWLERVAFNASYLLEPAEVAGLTESKFGVLLREAERPAGRARQLAITDFRLIESIRLPSPRGVVREERERYLARSVGAETAPPGKTKFGELFKRFSAFPDDARLRSDGSWRPRTYATTAEDALSVKTGMDAVARYALPNPRPAIYVFTGAPRVGTPIQEGIVQPANGQPGGGAEVLFPDGTTARSVTGPIEIPPGS